jgi:hypothetical protein
MCMFGMVGRFEWGFRKAVKELFHDIVFGAVSVLKC